MEFKSTNYQPMGKYQINWRVYSTSRVRPAIQNTVDKSHEFNMCRHIAIYIYNMYLNTHDIYNIYIYTYIWMYI